MNLTRQDMRDLFKPLGLMVESINLVILNDIYIGKTFNKYMATSPEKALEKIKNKIKEIYPQAKITTFSEILGATPDETEAGDLYLLHRLENLTPSQEALLKILSDKFFEEKIILPRFKYTHSRGADILFPPKTIKKGFEDAEFIEVELSEEAFKELPALEPLLKDFSTFRAALDESLDQETETFLKRFGEVKGREVFGVNFVMVKPKTDVQRALLEEMGFKFDKNEKAYVAPSFYAKSVANVMNLSMEVVGEHHKELKKIKEFVKKIERGIEECYQTTRTRVEV